MEVNTALVINKAGALRIRQLFESDIPLLQQLCVECSDFHQLTMGTLPSNHEGADIMLDCPPGKSPEDKVVFGIFSAQGQLVGVVELLRGYPQANTWFIGLMLLHPQWRGVNLGRDVLEWVEQYSKANCAQKLAIAVLEVNPRGHKFWQDNGFGQVRLVDNYQSGNIKTTAIVMEKAI